MSYRIASVWFSHQKLACVLCCNWWSEEPVPVWNTRSSCFARLAALIASLSYFSTHVHTHNIIDAGFHWRYGADVSHVSMKVKQNSFWLDLDIYTLHKFQQSLTTSCMEESISWEVDSYLAGQEMPYFVWNLKAKSYLLEHATELFLLWHCQYLRLYGFK